MGPTFCPETLVLLCGFRGLIDIVGLIIRIRSVGLLRVYSACGIYSSFILFEGFIGLTALYGPG